MHASKSLSYSCIIQFSIASAISVSANAYSAPRVGPRKSGSDVIDDLPVGQLTNKSVCE